MRIKGNNNDFVKVYTKLVYQWFDMRNNFCYL